MDVDSMPAVVNGELIRLKEKEHEEWLNKWCRICQVSPCIGKGCMDRGKKLQKFGFLASWRYRSDLEEKEVHELALEFPDTGWPIEERIII